MKIIAYLYIDPLLETAYPPLNWGLEVDEFYQDLGEREQLKKLLKDCQNQPPNYLIIQRLEDLGDTFENISDRLSFLEGLGIEIIAIDPPYNTSQFNPSDPSNWRNHLGKLFQQIETYQRRQRLRRGHARNRMQALPPPGKAPYGYRRGKDRYIIDRSTAPVVKDFFERFLLFGSLRGAVRYLEKRYGKKISVSTGKKWLTNPVYRGDLAYHNGETICDTHPPIISREEAAQIDRLLRRNSSLPPRTASAPRSLGGLVICESCQSQMTITQVTRRDKNKNYLYLRPMNCPLQPRCKGIPYQEVLSKTIEEICQELPPTVAQLNLPNLEGIKASLTEGIETKRKILNQLPDLQNQGILDQETTDLRRYKLRTEIAQLQTQLDQLPPGDLKIITQAVSIPQFWLDLSEAERRFYFREFIRQITLVGLPSKDWNLKLIFIF